MIRDLHSALKDQGFLVAAELDLVEVLIAESIRIASAVIWLSFVFKVPGTRATSFPLRRKVTCTAGRGLPGAYPPL